MRLTRIWPYATLPLTLLLVLGISSPDGPLYDLMAALGAVLEAIMRPTAQLLIFAFPVIKYILYAATSIAVGWAIFIIRRDADPLNVNEARICACVSAITVFVTLNMLLAGPLFALTLLVAAVVYICSYKDKSEHDKAGIQAVCSLFAGFACVIITLLSNMENDMRDFQNVFEDISYTADMTPIEMSNMDAQLKDALNAYTGHKKSAEILMSEGMTLRNISVRPDYLVLNVDGNSFACHIEDDRIIVERITTHRVLPSTRPVMEKICAQRLGGAS